MNRKYMIRWQVFVVYLINLSSTGIESLKFVSSFAIAGPISFVTTQPLYFISKKLDKLIDAGNVHSIEGEIFFRIIK